MAEPKTRATGASVGDFIRAIKDKDARNDCQTIAGIMQKATGAKPKMWGAGIVGFGTYRYRYADGRDAEWMITAFSPRKGNITLYIDSEFAGGKELLNALGKHKSGKSCIHIKRLSDVNLATLSKLVTAAVTHTRKKHSD